MKNKLFGFELKLGLEQSFAKICSHLGLKRCSIVWCSNATTASINAHRQIRLPNLKDDASFPQATFRKYLGYCLHELLHHKYTDFSVINSYSAYLDSLHNAVEDAWIERTAIAQKIVPNVEEVLLDLVNGIIEESLTEVRDWTAVGIYPFALAIYLRGYCKRVPLAKGLEDIFEEAFKRIDNCKNSADTMTIAEWVYAQLQLPPQPPQNPSDQPQPGDQASGKGTPGNQPGDSNAVDKSDKPGESDKPGGGRGVGERKPVTAKFGRIRQVEPMIKEPDFVVGNGLFEKKSLVRDNYHTGGYKFDTSVNVPGRLRYEVKQLFENSALDNFEMNRKSGQLNSSALHSIGHSNRLFKRHHETAGIDSAVVILLDVSGSMFDCNNAIISIAVPTCATLLDTLNRAKVKTALMTFGDETSIVKGFNTPLNQALKSISELHDGGGTKDYCAVVHAHNMLMTRSEKRKVAFVITDGEGDSHATKEQVEIGERMGITTIGVGIGADVKRVFSNSVTVRNAKDLATATFKQIKLA